MISFGEKFAIMLPSIFFFVVSIINTLENANLLIEIGKYITEDNNWELHIREISIEILTTTYSSTYIEFIILSITNGLSTIFVLNEPIIGTFFIIIGIIISLFGFKYIGIEKHLVDKEKKIFKLDNEYEKKGSEIKIVKREFNLTKKIETLSHILSISEIGYIGLYGISGFNKISTEYIPWIGFFFGAVFGFIFDKYLLPHLYP